MARNDDDLDLVRRCVAREPGAWSEFVDRFKGTAVIVARRYLTMHGQAHEGVDDVVQDVFFAVTRRDFRLLKNYDPRYTFKTYFGVITRTEVHRRLRKKRPVAADPADFDRAEAAGSDPTETAAAAEQKEALTAALDSLPGRDAEILRLRFLREMDYQTIASTMRIPEASVGQTLFRAKQRLLQRLGGGTD